MSRRFRRCVDVSRDAGVLRDANPQGVLRDIHRACRGESVSRDIHKACRGTSTVVARTTITAVGVPRLPRGFRRCVDVSRDAGVLRDAGQMSWVSCEMRDAREMRARDAGGVLARNVRRVNVSLGNEVHRPGDPRPMQAIPIATHVRSPKAQLAWRYLDGLGRRSLGGAAGSPRRRRSGADWDGTQKGG